MVSFFTKIKKNWKNYAIGILAVFLVFSFLGSNIGNMGVEAFSSYDSYSSKSVAMEADSFYRGGSSPYYNNVDDALDVTDRKIIRNANIDLESDNYDDSKNKIDALVKDYSAIVLSNNEYKNKKEYRTSNYRVKVDSSKIDLFVSELKNYGEVESANIYSNDVTGSFVDFSDRVERYEGQITKYEVMLLKKDITVEEEVQIQTRIDQIEDMLFYLRKNIGNLEEDITYSDVSITLSEEESLIDEVDFVDLEDSSKLFVGSLGSAIELVLMILGFVIPFLVVYIVYRFGRKLFYK